MNDNNVSINIEFNFVIDDRNLYCLVFFSFTTISKNNLIISFIIKIITLFITNFKKKIIYIYNYFLYKDVKIVTIVTKFSQKIVTNARNNKFETIEILEFFYFKRARVN